MVMFIAQIFIFNFLKNNQLFIQMSLSPSSRSFDDPYKLDVRRKMTLKIDGLIDRHSADNLKRFREVKRVKLLLNSYKLEKKQPQKVSLLSDFFFWFF